MTSPHIKDYALIGDCETAALVSRTGSIDWLCLPRFDSPACFAALLGTPDHGRWLLAPAHAPREVRRHYHDGTLVLETEFETAQGRVAVVDCMPPRSEVPDVLRVVHAHIVYGAAGERLLPEWELEWLPGHADSRPVRVGNAAATQFQLDVYGEVMDALHSARRHGVAADEDAWWVQRELVRYVESAWREPDEGIWEVRGPRRHFTHSKVMPWVALDRAVKGIEHFDARLGAFVQYYGSPLLDASLLMIPLVGFLPADDPRMLGTVRAIERHLTTDRFVARYATRREVDGLPPGEGALEDES